MSKITEDIKDVVKSKPKRELIEFLPTGSTIIELIGGGGHPVGKIINIIGDKSTGKTLLVIEALFYMKKKLKDKLRIYYDDCESGFSFDLSDIYGDRFFQEVENPSSSIEEFMCTVDKQIEAKKKDDYLVYVVDSLDGLTSEAEQKRHIEMKKAKEAGKNYDGGTYGLEKQKKLSEFFRLSSNKLKKEKVLLIIISQVRFNIGAIFGAKYARTGGKALDFYCAQIFWLSEVEKEKRKNRVIGITVKVRCTKNKVGKPFREGFVNILFDYGVDNITSNIDFFYDLRTDSGKLKSRRAKVEWDKKEYTRRALISCIEDNDLEKALESRVIGKWFDLEQEVSPQDRKKK